MQVLEKRILLFIVKFLVTYLFFMFVFKVHKKQLPNNEEFVTVLVNVLAASQSYMRQQKVRFRLNFNINDVTYFAHKDYLVFAELQILKEYIKGIMILFIILI